MKGKQLLTFAAATVIAGISLIGVSTATSDYIYEKMVNGTGTITICDPDSNGTKCITMMDKNLGATSTDITSTSSYGNHFQWGNNYGFQSCYENECTNIPNGTKTTNRITCYDDTIYNRNQFAYSVGDWCNMTPIHGNLRGGDYDNQSNNRGYNMDTMQAINVTGRQGPCGEGYHVPSIGEWNKIIERWASENGIQLDNFGYGLHRSYEDVGLFFEDFKIPLAGDRYWYNAEITDMGSEAVFWSSSHEGGNGNINISYFLELGPNLIRDGQQAEHSNGFSVRCFKNSAVIPPENFIMPIIDSGFQTTVGESIEDGLPDEVVITINNEVNDLEDEEEQETLAGEVTVSFGENVTAKFNKLVRVNVPVDDYDKVIIKVKHGGSNEYNFDGLTTNASASCDANGRPTSNQYNGTPITVVDGFASIYTCEASSFIALGIPPVEVQINLSILKGILTIGVETGNLNLGQVNVSNSSQELSGSFGTNSFWVEDMKGVESGYYTTISVTDLTGSVASHVIPANNISLKTAGNAPTNISGATADEAKVIFGEGITSWHSGSGQINYFQRLNTSTADAGRVGKWGDNLQIKVNIPAHTPSDIYRGTITYTLYDNDL